MLTKIPRLNINPGTQANVHREPTKAPPRYDQRKIRNPSDPDFDLDDEREDLGLDPIDPDLSMEGESV